MSENHSNLPDPGTGADVPPQRPLPLVVEYARPEKITSSTLLGRVMARLLSAGMALLGMLLLLAGEINILQLILRPGETRPHRQEDIAAYIALLLIGLTLLYYSIRIWRNFRRKLAGQ